MGFICCTAYSAHAARPLSFLLEVVEAVVAEVGAHKVGIRLSPFNK